MRPRLLTNLARSQDAAVAPTVALSLFGLIAVGGIAFDYARMATLDTELQAAADQAALAAATQLDGKDGACSRAAYAAVNLVANQTRFANEAGGNLAVTVPLETACDQTGNVRFYKTKARAAAATDADAKFVEVTVNTREAFFALTPIVQALRSGALTGTAFAGLGSAICKVPPVMMCNPNEPGSTDFSPAAGVGLRLLTGDATAPGNFGYLDTDAYDGNGTPELKTLIGYDTPPGNCSPTTGVDLKTGNRPEVMDALNTRFDIFDSQNCPQDVQNSGYFGSCSASANVRKDLVQGTSGVCTTGGTGWVESSNPYRPDSPTPLTSSTGYPDVMGYPRDLCHAVKKDAQTCGVVGSSTWDRDAYFHVNYNWDNTTWKSQTGLNDNARRYEVYQWELNNKNVGGKGIGVAQPVSGKTAYGTPQCSPKTITPSASEPDRRRISVAVINCKALGLNGSEKGVTVLKWLDVFFVEPSIKRGKGKNDFTAKDEVYVEVIEETKAGASGFTAGQVTRRDVPYLIE